MGGGGKGPVNGYSEMISLAPMHAATPWFLQQILTLKMRKDAYRSTGKALNCMRSIVNSHAIN